MFLFFYITPMVDSPRNIFDFNHIDTTLSKGKRNMLKTFTPTTTKRITATKSCTAATKEKNLICHVVAGKAVITAAVAGNITLNSIVLASLRAFGVIVKIVASATKYDKKSKEPTWHLRSIKKFLIRFYLRRDPFDKLKMIDDFVSDHCMEILNQISRKYDKLFLAL